MTRTARKFSITATDHSSVTVSSLDEALAFWHGILGFEIEKRSDFKGGAFVEGMTGIPGAEFRNAVLVAPGHRVELIEYRNPPARATMMPRPCDVGSTHICFEAEALDELLSEIAILGWKAQGPPQLILGGARAGYRVVYVRGPDGVLIEFLEPGTKRA